MRPNIRSSTTALLALLALALAPSATAAVVDVRIEGKTQTLFEGPIRTEGHSIRASSDTQARPCDGTNGSAHPGPGPTPTTAGVDAMSLIGETFDGTWSSSSDDYFITRWGPEAQDAAEGEYWGLLVDETFLSVGGCQDELAEGDQVLWAYNAFDHDQFLTLDAAGESPGAAIPTPTVALGQPLTLKVESYNGNEGKDHTLGPYTGAEISPVATAANGFESVETGNPSSVTTAASGTATITFTTSGWHRLKATASKTFRSNRLDVCVPASGASNCGPLLFDDQARPAETLPSEAEHKDLTPPTDGSPGSPSSHSGTPGASAPRKLHLGGLVLSPTDDRSSHLIFRGHWRREKEPSAWDGTVTVGVAGATVTVRLAAGRPVFVLRDIRHRARIEVIEGMRHRTFIIHAGGGASRLLIAPRQAHPGKVKLRILDGTIGLDAVALTR